MKVTVSFNQLAYETSVNSFQMNINKLIKCLDNIEVITGSRSMQSLAEIEQFICNKSNFKNVKLSSELLDIAKEYAYLETNLNTINHEVIEFIDNVPFTKESILKQVKESNTSYLKEQFISDYEVLKKASEILNKISNPALVNCLKTDYAGRYSVNLLQLNNSNRI
jgi:hypothetical protein